MEMATYLLTAVLVEGRSVREVARDHGVSKTWLYELLSRYKELGEAGLAPRSRSPRTSPQKISAYFEDEIVRVRKELTDLGFDAGAETIRVHLKRKHRRARVPSTSTIWRVLKSRGFVVSEPHKRPKSSYVRFCADLPNERWQMDVTHVVLAGGLEVEVLNVIDDHSRLCVASHARRITKAIDVVTTFHEAAARYGFPASVLSDNGAIFTAEARHGVCVMETELLSLGIAYKHSRPYHPAGSTSVRKELGELLRWFHESEGLAWTVVETSRDAPEVLSAVNG
jgi:transposase InsO family protein